MTLRNVDKYSNHGHLPSKKRKRISKTKGSQQSASSPKMAPKRALGGNIEGFKANPIDQTKAHLKRMVGREWVGLGHVEMIFYIELLQSQ
jgi:hypothetical protein